MFNIKESKEFNGCFSINNKIFVCGDFSGSINFNIITNENFFDISKIGDYC